MQDHKRAQSELRAEVEPPVNQNREKRHEKEENMVNMKIVILIS